MSDIREVQGNEGNSGFASEWKRLAREETGEAGQPDPDSEASRDPIPDEPAGQGGDAPPSEAAPQDTAGEVTDDVWAGVPEPVRKAFEAEKAAREKAENAIRIQNGRASKAEREVAELRARLTAPAPAATPAQPEAQPEIPEHLRAVSEEYEDVAGPLVKEILELRQSLSRLEAQGASAAEQERTRHELELREFLAAQESKLTEAHSDWKKVVVDPAFVEWVQTGPQFIRDGIARNGNGIVDAAESAEILALFKARQGAGTPDQIAERRRAQLEGARAVPARSPGATVSGGPDDFQAEWARLREKERREAQRR